MPHGAFNANFYVAAATVIPVLYLALTLQGPTVRRLMERGIDQSYKVLMLELKKESNKSWRQRQAEIWGRSILTVAFIYTNFIIFSSGIIGESIAIVALYHESASTLSGEFVLGATIGLLAVIAASQLFIIATGPSLTRRLNEEKEEKRLGETSNSQDSSELTANEAESDSSQSESITAETERLPGIEQSTKIPHGRHEKPS
jgi:hypothetical protein